MQSALEETTIQVDESGRIALPQLMCEHMQIEPGTTLIVERTGTDEVRLRVTRETAPLICEDGLLVIQSVPVGDIENAIENEREARLAIFLEGVHSA